MLLAGLRPSCSALLLPRPNHSLPTQVYYTPSPDRTPPPDPGLLHHLLRAGLVADRRPLRAPHEFVVLRARRARGRVDLASHRLRLATGGRGDSRPSALPLASGRAGGPVCRVGVLADGRGCRRGRCSPRCRGGGSVVFYPRWSASGWGGSGGEAAVTPLVCERMGRIRWRSCCERMGRIRWRSCCDVLVCEREDPVAKLL